MNDELERILKEAVVGYFSVLLRHSLEEPRKTMKGHFQDSRHPGRNSSWELPH
jgi:hypothetical protein